MTKDNKNKKQVAKHNWYIKHQEEQSLFMKNWRKEHEGYSSRKHKEWYQNHKKEWAEYQRERRKSLIQVHLAESLRWRINRAVRNGSKIGSAVCDLGCPVDDFKVYLESLFLDGMTWNNRSNWHIDHIIPLSSFDLEDREQFLKACHYTNLQPLWAIDNLKKGNKIV